MERFVKHSCGHTVRQEVQGINSNKRDSKAAWLSEKPCLDCLREKQLSHAEEVGLPELVGSESQIEWAKSIRAHYLSFIGGEPDQKILTNLEAKYWIDKRKSLFKKKSA